MAIPMFRPNRRALSIRGWVGPAADREPSALSAPVRGGQEGREAGADCGAEPEHELVVEVGERCAGRAGIF